ncbi:MAG: hypothetical protein ICV67_03035 [Thermoleophilia bacterium]|nr:hypothetical protein [Thermoleophilia bacterium]
MRRRRTTLLLSAVGTAVALALPAPAAARGGDYVLEGGSGAAQTQVRRALEASAFDWGIVPTLVARNIGPGFPNRLVARRGSGPPALGVRGRALLLSTRVWAYWPSRYNAYWPRAPRDEAGAVSPSAFRALIASVLAS